MVNKYPGTCEHCGSHVARNAGKLRKAGRGWAVAHLACADKRSPQVDTFRFSSGHVAIRNVNGRCEDAPCCGCCTI